MTEFSRHQGLKSVLFFPVPKQTDKNRITVTHRNI